MTDRRDSSRPPPRRPSSITIAIDRDKLPPISRGRIEAAAASYPELPGIDDEDIVLTEATPSEQAEMLGARRRAQDDTPTGVSCPQCSGCPACRGTHVERTATGYARCSDACSTCDYCGGDGWVTVERAIAWRALHTP